MSRTIHGRSEELVAYWTMVLPAVLLYLLVLGFPIAISIILSLSNYNGGKMFGGQPWKIVGLQQYAKLIHDPYFWTARVMKWEHVTVKLQPGGLCGDTNNW